MCKHFTYNKHKVVFAPLKALSPVKSARVVECNIKAFNSTLIAKGGGIRGQGR